MAIKEHWDILELILLSPNVEFEKDGAPKNTRIGHCRSQSFDLSSDIRVNTGSSNGRHDRSSSIGTKDEIVSNNNSNKNSDDSDSGSGEFNVEMAKRLAMLLYADCNLDNLTRLSFITSSVKQHQRQRQRAGAGEGIGTRERQGAMKIGKPVCIESKTDTFTGGTDDSGDDGDDLDGIHLDGLVATLDEMTPHDSDTDNDSDLANISDAQAGDEDSKQVNEENQLIKKEKEKEKQEEKNDKSGKNGKDGKAEDVKKEISMSDILNFKIALDTHLKESIFKIGCFMDLYYSIKDLEDNNGNVNDDNVDDDYNNENQNKNVGKQNKNGKKNKNKNKTSRNRNKNKKVTKKKSNKGKINNATLVLTKFISYFGEFEKNRKEKNASKFLLTGSNPFETRNDKSPKTLMDIINESRNIDLKQFLLSKYWNTIPITTATNASSNNQLSNDVLNDLKILKLTNTRINVNVNININEHDSCGPYGWPQLIPLNKSNGVSLRMTQFDKFECLLIGCYYLTVGMTDSEHCSQKKFFENLENRLDGCDLQKQIDIMKQEIEWSTLKSLIFSHMDVVINDRNDRNDNDNKKDDDVAVTTPQIVKTSSQEPEQEDKQEEKDETKQETRTEEKNYDVDIAIKLAMLLFSCDLVFDEMLKLSFVSKIYLLDKMQDKQEIERKMSKLRTILNEHFFNVVLEIGCFMDLYSILDKSMANDNGIGFEDDDEEEKETAGAIAMKFISYFGYFDDNNNNNNNNNNKNVLLKGKNAYGESGKTLSQKIQETNDTTLINFVLEKYFAAEDKSLEIEEKIRETIMNHSRYIHESFSKANEGLSSLENGDETAVKLFEKYYDKGGFGDKCTKDTFVSRMRTFIEAGRQKIPKDLKEKEGKKEKIQYPRNSYKNSRILNQLNSSNDSMSIVENHLKVLYDNICKLDSQERNKSKKKEKGKDDKTESKDDKQENKDESGKNEVKENENKEENDASAVGGVEVKGGAKSGKNGGAAGTEEGKNNNSNNNGGPGQDGSSSNNESNSFRARFCRYLASIFATNRKQQSEKSFSATVPNFLAILILQSSLFWEIADYMEKRRSIEENEEIQFEEITKFFKWGLLDVCAINKKGESLYHIAANNDDRDVLKLLLEIDNDINKYVIDDDERKTPLNTAMTKGHWQMVKDISLAKMGSKIKNKAKETEKIVTLNRGIAYHILDRFDEKDMNTKGLSGSSLMEQIVVKMEKLIADKLPISDHLLLACWKYERKTKKKVNRIWKAIKAQVLEICAEPQDDRDWYWFQLYIINSAIWYEEHDDDDDDDNLDEMKSEVESEKADKQKNTSDTRIVFDNLTEIVSKEIDSQRQTLFDEFKELGDDPDQQQSFDAMVQFKHYVVNDKDADEHGLRQDNERLLTFPNKLKFMNSNSFQNNMNNILKYKLKDLCDTRIYLSSLIIVAKTLNDSFHQSMRKMISKLNNNKCSYKAGPIKQLERAQAKAESDYASKPFPTSSHILDLLRGSLTYTDCNSLMKGVESVKEMIEENTDGRHGCVKRILRIKNTFLKNYTEHNKNNNSNSKNNSGIDGDDNSTDNKYGWMRKYGDIKFNVLIEHNGASMIGEIQFLLGMFSIFWVFGVDADFLPVRQRVQQFFFVCLCQCGCVCKHRNNNKKATIAINL